MNSQWKINKPFSLIKAVAVPLLDTIRFLRLALLVAALIGWAGTTMGALTGFNQTTAGSWDYNTAGNWAGSTINGVWHSSLALAANQVVTFAADTALGTGLTFNYTGNPSLTLQAAAAGTVNLTLDGDVALDTSGASASVTIGNSVNHLNVNLNGLTRVMTVAASRTLTLNDVVSNGAITKSGDGTLVLNPGNLYSGTTTIKAGTLTLNGTGVDAAGTSAIILGDSSGVGSATLNFSANTGIGPLANNITVSAGPTGNLVINSAGNNVAIFNGAIALNNNLTFIKGNGTAFILNGLITQDETAHTITNTARGVRFGGGIQIGSGGLTLVEGIGASGNSTSIMTVSNTVTGTGDLTLQNNCTNSALPNSIILACTSINHTGAIVNSGAGTNTVVISGPIGINVKTVVQNGVTSTLLLSGTNTYYGPTLILSGTNALGINGSITNSANISIAAGAIFDVSSKTTYTLSASNTLSASGTDTGSGAATIKGGTTVSLASRPIILTISPTTTADTTHPALFVSSGALALTNNAFAITNNSGSALLAGTYRLIQVGDGSSGAINQSGSPVYTVNVYLPNGANGLVGGATAAITVSSGNVVLTVTGGGTPTLTASGSLSAVSTTYGTPSGSTTFTVEGAALAGNITVTAPTGFEVSTASGNGFGGSVILTQSGGAVGSTTLYVRLAAATLAGPYSGNVVCASPSATPVNVATVSSTVAPYALTVSSPSVTAKIYDGTTAATISGTLSATVNGDVISLVGAGTFADRNAANGISVTAACTLSGTHASSYTLTQPTGLTGNITPKALTVSGITADSTVYDGTTTAKLGGTAAFLAAEAVGPGTTSDGKPYDVDAVAPGTVTGSLVLKDAGTRAVTTSVTVTGTGNANYMVTSQAGLTQAVTAKALTVTGITAGSTNYDGTTVAKLGGMAALQVAEAPGAGTTSDGKAYTGDTINLGGTVVGTLAAKDVGTRAVTITGNTLSGDQASNYTLIQQTSLTQQITAATLTVTADNKVRATNTANPAFTYTITGYQNGENAVTAGVTGAPTLSAEAIPASPAGAYTITCAANTLAAANYAFVPVNGTLTVADFVAKWAAGTGAWDINTTANWKTNGVATVYEDGWLAQFDDTATGTGPFTVTLDANVSPASITVTNGTKNYTLSGTGSINGSASLIKQGAGTLTFSDSNTFSGGLTIAGGKVVLTSANNAGSGTITLGDVTPGNSNPANLNNNVGPIITNAIVVAAGSSGLLQVSAFGNSSFRSSGPMALNNDLTLGQANSAQIHTFSGLITEDNAAHTIALGAYSVNATLSGGIVVGSGGLTLVNASVSTNTFIVGTGNITGAGPLTFNANTACKFTISASSINNAGSITNSGVGGGTNTMSGTIGPNVTAVVQANANSVLILSGANTYAGPTAINAGTLTLGVNGSISNSAGISIAAGATFDVSAKPAYVLSTNLTASSTATLRGGSGGTVNFGTCQVTLNYDGVNPLTVSQATLQLNGNTFVVNGGALSPGSSHVILQAAGAITSTASYTVSGTAIGSSMATISVVGSQVIVVLSPAGSVFSIR